MSIAKCWRCCWKQDRNWILSWWCICCVCVHNNAFYTDEDRNGIRIKCTSEFCYFSIVIRCRFRVLIGKTQSRNPLEMAELFRMSLSNSQQNPFHVSLMKSDDQKINLVTSFTLLTWCDAIRCTCVKIDIAKDLHWVVVGLDVPLARGRWPVVELSLFNTRKFNSSACICAVLQMIVKILNFWTSIQKEGCKNISSFHSLAQSNNDPRFLRLYSSSQAHMTVVSGNLASSCKYNSRHLENEWKCSRIEK